MMINELVDGGESFVRPQEILTVSIGQDFEMLRAAAMSEKKKSAAEILKRPNELSRGSSPHPHRRSLQKAN